MSDFDEVEISVIVTYEGFVLMPPNAERETFARVLDGDDPEQTIRRKASQRFGMAIPSSAEVRLSADGKTARVVLDAYLVPDSGEWLDVDTLMFAQSTDWGAGVLEATRAGLEL